jgi:hypothetical protein
MSSHHDEMLAAAIAEADRALESDLKLLIVNAMAFTNDVHTERHVLGLALNAIGEVARTLLGDDADVQLCRQYLAIRKA